MYVAASRNQFPNNTYTFSFGARSCLEFPLRVDMPREPFKRKHLCGREIRLRCIYHNEVIDGDFGVLTPKIPGWRFFFLSTIQKQHTKTTFSCPQFKSNIRKLLQAQACSKLNAACTSLNIWYPFFVWLSPGSRVAILLYMMTSTSVVRTAVTMASTA